MPPRLTDAGMTAMQIGAKIHMNNTKLESLPLNMAYMAKSAPKEPYAIFDMCPATLTGVCPATPAAFLNYNNYSCPSSNYAGLFGHHSQSKTKP